MNRELTIMRRARPWNRALYAFLPILLCACQSTKGSQGGTDEEWLAPSPQLKQRIEEQAASLPWTHGIERVELIRWFAGVGEPCYPTLLAMVQDPRSDVAGAALAALGATRDSRLVPHLRAVPWPATGASVDLALERARTLLRLGDWSMLPHMIDGLEDSRLMTRALCAQALYEVTKERFGFDPRGDEELRGASVQRWREWWAERNADPLLPSVPQG